MEKIIDRGDVKVLIYNGDLDYKLNYLGIERTIARDLNWKQKKNMVFDVDGKQKLELSPWMYKDYRGR